MSSSEAPSLAAESRQTLLAVARRALEHGVHAGRVLRVVATDYAPELGELRATFVTLRRQGELRGCIGTCEPLRPLVEDVAHNAYAAAFRDPRFPPLTATELPSVEIHISLLSIPRILQCASEADLLRQVRPGVDGLLLEDGVHRGTLLPSVWEVIPEACNFIRQLKLKAGLPADYWSADLIVRRYTAESIVEA